MFCQEQDEGGESRALRDSDLRVSAPHLQRVSSINLQLLERDARRRNKTQPDQPQVCIVSPPLLCTIRSTHVCLLKL